MALNEIEVVLHEGEVSSEILFSPKVAAGLLRRGNAVVAGAGGTSAGFRAVVQRGKDRNRVAVWTATPHARNAEAKDHRLLRALDAAR